MVQSKDSILREKSGLCYHPGQHLTPSEQCRDERWGKERNTESNEKKQHHECEIAQEGVPRRGWPREMDGEKEKEREGVGEREQRESTWERKKNKKMGK